MDRSLKLPQFIFLQDVDSAFLCRIVGGSKTTDLSVNEPQCRPGLVRHTAPIALFPLR